MADSHLVQQAGRYAALRQITIDFENPLGFGQDGKVWKSNRRSAVKSFDRQLNYLKELACYQRLAEHDVTEIGGFSVPRLVDSDDDLFIVEMDIVSPPYLLDFGKAYLDYAPEHSPETIAYAMRERAEWWEDRLPKVNALLAELECLGIYYQDPKPGNIMFGD